MEGTAGSGYPLFGTIAPAPPQMAKKNATAGSKLGITAGDALSKHSVYCLKEATSGRAGFFKAVEKK
jgi:hypothetical protein